MRHLAFALVLLLATPLARAENWPGFRGPDGQGRSAETGLPTQWSATENIAWKVPVPGVGWSSPIVWDDCVFLTTALPPGESFHLLCFDRKTGQTRWDKQVFQQDIRGRREGRNSYATATPVTDGRLVYVRGFDGTLAAVDFSGNIAWTNRDHYYYSQHGFAASPILYGDLLISNHDSSSPGPDKTVGWKKPWDGCKIIALDKATGKERWIGKRGLSRISHAMPAILKTPAGDQLITSGGDVLQAFDLKTGERLWSGYGQGESVVPGVIIGDGLVYAASGFEKPTIRAWRPGGKGDVTQTHVAWAVTKGVPTVPSFTYVKPHLFVLTEGGIATCLKGDTGEIVWQERVGGEYGASPVYAEGRLYLLSADGTTTILEAGPQYKVVGKNALGEKCQASPAISQKQFFIRTEKNLICIGK